MLIHNNRINTIVQPNSANRLIRNGVGVRADGRILFAIAREPVNAYTFAAFFQKQGCPNALYLDGTVSQVYVAGQNMPPVSSAFGVMIAVVSAAPDRVR